MGRGPGGSERKKRPAEAGLVSSVVTDGSVVHARAVAAGRGARIAHLVDHPVGESRYGAECMILAEQGCVPTRWNSGAIPPHCAPCPAPHGRTLCPVQLRFPGSIDPGSAVIRSDLRHLRMMAFNRRAQSAVASAAGKTRTSTLLACSGERWIRCVARTKSSALASKIFGTKVCGLRSMKGNQVDCTWIMMR